MAAKFQLSSFRTGVTEDLIYPAPTEGELACALEALYAVCTEDAERTLPTLTRHIRKDRMLRQVKKELVCIQKSKAASAIFLMAEIAKLSAKEGYPTALFGPAAGMLVPRLMGINSLYPDAAGFDRIPSDMACDRAAAEGRLAFELAIAPPVRDKILPALEKRFPFFEGQKGLYETVDLSHYLPLESIGAMGAETGIAYTALNTEDPALIGKVYRDLCRTDLPEEPDCPPPATLQELARVYAYARCGGEDKPPFSRVKDWVFRDDFYRLLKDARLSEAAVLRIIRDWSKGEKKQWELQVLREQGAGEEALFAFERLHNLWDAANCLVRVNALLCMAAYQQDQ